MVELEEIVSDAGLRVIPTARIPRPTDVRIAQTVTNGIVRLQWQTSGHWCVRGWSVRLCDRPWGRWNRINGAQATRRTAQRNERIYGPIVAASEILCRTGLVKAGQTRITGERSVTGNAIRCKYRKSIAAKHGCIRCDGSAPF